MGSRHEHAKESDPSCGEKETRRSRMPKRQRRKHLYLILDDWSRGYSIRELDLSSDSDSGDLLCWRCTGRRDRAPHRRGERCLPPPIFHVEAPREMTTFFAGAFGTKIMSMHPRYNPRYLYHYHHVTPGPVSIFDVRTRSLSFGRRPDPPSRHENPIYIPAGGDRLLALSGASFHLLSTSSIPAASAAPAGRGARSRPRRSVPMRSTCTTPTPCTRTGGPSSSASRRSATPRSVSTYRRRMGRKGSPAAGNSAARGCCL
ncbi:unnamed protein product [Urochloa humidicola]